MGKVSLKGRHTYRTFEGEKQGIILIENAKFEKFKPDVLGLGDISLPSSEVEALVAIFDLSGFTIFCNQVDPHLAIPEYLSRFLDWLFTQIRERLRVKNYKNHKAMYAQFPFLAKFLGDGVLLIWDTRDMSETLICNIVTLLCEIRDDYREDFYPLIKKDVVNPPEILRCGIARGRVCSVGNGQDYVGPCINIASRLQKLSLLTFSFPRKGFNIEKYMHPSIVDNLIEKRIAVKFRGIEAGELIWVLKEEFDNLPDEEKTFFGEP